MRKNAEMTEMEKKMYAARGHEVEVHLDDSIFKDNICCGKCVCYTPYYDNTPEISSIDIKHPSYPTGLYEFYENDIVDIIILD